MAIEDGVAMGGTQAQRALNGVLFLGGLELAYNVYGGTNSSPQTTELFAAERESTLMRWVSIAGAKCVAYGLLASWIARSLWPLIGVGLGTALMHCLYLNAARRGRNTPPPANATPTRGAVSTRGWRYQKAPTG